MVMYEVCMTVDDVWWTGGHERCDLLLLIIPGQSICHTLATPGLYAGPDGTPLLHGPADPVALVVAWSLHHTLVTRGASLVTRMLVWCLARGPFGRLLQPSPRI